EVTANDVKHVLPVAVVQPPGGFGAAGTGLTQQFVKLIQVAVRRGAALVGRGGRPTIGEHGRAPLGNDDMGPSNTRRSVRKRPAAGQGPQEAERETERISRKTQKRCPSEVAFGNL